MANYTINLQQAFIEAFGVTGLRRFPDASQHGAKSDSQLFTGINEIPVLEKGRKNQLGTPIFMPFSTLAGTYKARDGKTLQSVDRPFAAYNFPSTTLVDFNQAKTIIKTKIQGREGSVKELIAKDDFEINIRGLLVSAKGSSAYPSDHVKLLKDLFNVPAAIPVQGKMFEYLGIYNIVIERWSLPALEGYQNIQPFTFQCISDTPIELKLKDGL